MNLTWSRSGYDVAGSTQPIVEYSVWRRIEGSAKSADPTTDKLYPPGDWHFLTTIPADGEDQYSVVVPTLGDSTVVDGQHYSTYFVRARTSTPGEYFDAAPDSGYSLDNLAPALPTGFLVASPGVLAWDESSATDLQYFTVYGSPSGAMDGNTAVILCERESRDAAGAYPIAPSTQSLSAILSIEKASAVPR